MLRLFENATRNTPFRQINQFFAYFFLFLVASVENYYILCVTLNKRKHEKSKNPQSKLCQRD